MELRRVIFTHGGRRSTLEVLVCHLSREYLLGHFDKWIICVNATVPEDIEFMRRLESSYSWIDLQFHPDAEANGAICLLPSKWYVYFQDRDTIYVNLDDDIVWVEPNAIRDIIQFRVDNPEYFIIFGNIINNAICGYIHQRLGSYPEHNLTYDIVDKNSWGSAHFAKYVHETFLNDVHLGEIDKYKFSRWVMKNGERFSINVTCFFGKDLMLMQGILPHSDDEEALSVVLPDMMERPACIFGQKIFSHFAFRPQFDGMSQTSVLQKYRKLSGLE